MKSRKVQPTLKGYSDWVIAGLERAKGISAAEATAWVIDQWIDTNKETLEREYSITREEYLRSQPRVVVRMPSRAGD